MIRCRSACFEMLLGVSLGVVLILAALAASFSTQATESSMRAPVIVAFGDSLIAGFGLPESDTFPVQLERALAARGRKVTVVNAGVSGDTTAAGLARLDWSLPEDASAVILELGANDALQGLDPAATKTTLERIIVRIKERGLPILLAGMEAPRNMGKDYVAAFGALYPELAETHDVLLYPFFLDGAALDGTLMQPDGLHPNAKGVAKIVDGILPKVEELLDRADPKG